MAQNSMNPDFRIKSTKFTATVETAVFIILLLVSVQCISGQEKGSKTGEEFFWTKYATLPVPPGQSVQPGLAGAISGVIGQNLIVAGGANFPDKPVWDGGEKKWWRHIYVHSLEDSSENWKIYHDKLPHPLAYGVSVTLPEGILCIGGSDAQRAYAEVFLLRYVGDSIVFDPWPSLPVPLSNMSGALVDGKVFIAGGQEDMVKPAASDYFLMLDIMNREKGWQELETWPGPPRIFAAAAGQSDGFDNCFYLFSGRNIGPDKPLEILFDGYEYNPRLNTWKKLDTPRGPEFPVMAGAALASGAHHIIFFGGVDGQLAMEEYCLRQALARIIKDDVSGQDTDSVRILQEKIRMLQANHPGFSRDIRLYHTITNTLVTHSSCPFQLPVNTNIVTAGNIDYLISGELRPGVRSPLILTAESKRTVMAFGILNWIVIVLYFGALILMGFYFAGRQKTSDDYFRGGGRVPWWVAGLSIFGTALSSITFMAIPAKAYATDWSYIFMNAGIILVAPLIIYLFIPFFRRLNLTTAYEYLEQRFNMPIRIICSVSYILYQIGRMGVVILLPSIAINIVTGTNIFLCIGLMGILSLVYTMMGGIEAVVWTDAMQVVVLLGGAIVAIVFMIDNVDGGLNTILNTGAAESKFHTASTAFDFKNPTLWTVLIATLFAKTTEYGSDQTLVQRYLTTKDIKTASDSVWTNAALTVPATLIFFFIGTCLYVYYKTNPSLLSYTVNDGDAIFPWFIVNSLPNGISGLVIGGIFAAAMSTLSASMNSSATAYCVDIHFRFNLSKHNQLSVAKIATLIIGITGVFFAVLMATWDIASLWDEMQKILGLVLGGLGGLFMLGLVTRKANGQGALIGLTGSIITQIFVMRTGLVHLLLYAATGFISCFIIGYFSSLFFSQNKEITHLTIFRKK